MGEAKPFQPEKLVLAILASRETLSGSGLRQRLRNRLEGSFGPLDYESSQLPFTFSHYYDAELGTPLVRQLVAFGPLVDPQELARIKIATNRLEEEFRRAGAATRVGRLVNLDPGLLSLSRLILASTKDGSHRVPLASGIFAEITLQYRRPCFRPLPWTYPDYRSEEILRALLDIRALLKLQTRAASGEPPVSSPEDSLPNGSRQG
jgi:hypothetical protein